MLKTKDEEFLLELWLKYYINLIGKENIIVMDDSSTSKKIVDLYKKYNVEVKQNPYSDDPDKIHIHWVKENKKYIENECYFFAIFDTDEFLCFFDFEQNQIDNSKLLPFLMENKNNTAFTTTWIINSCIGKSFSQPEDVLDFNFTIHKKYTENGKIIANTSSSIGNVGHNISAMRSITDKRDEIYCTPNLFLLHLQHVNFRSRFLTMLNHLKTKKHKHLKFDTVEELQNILKQKDYKSLNYTESYVLHYLNNINDEEGFAKQHGIMPPPNITKFQTNLLRNFPENKPYITEFVNDINNKKEFIEELFKFLK